MFPANMRRRDHVQDRLRGAFCTFDTRKNGTPHTLVVFKTELEWEGKVREWKGRVDTAGKAIKEVGIQKLKGLLGAEWENEVGWSGIRALLGDEVGGRRPLGDAVQAKGTSLAGTKRKASERDEIEIIDLEDD